MQDLIPDSGFFDQGPTLLFVMFALSEPALLCLWPFCDDLHTPSWGSQIFWCRWKMTFGLKGGYDTQRPRIRRDLSKRTIALIFYFFKSWNWPRKIVSELILDTDFLVKNDLLYRKWSMTFKYPGFVEISTRGLSVLFLFSSKVEIDLKKRGLRFEEKVMSTTIPPYRTTDDQVFYIRVTS